MTLPVCLQHRPVASGTPPARSTRGLGKAHVRPRHAAFPSHSARREKGNLPATSCVGVRPGGVGTHPNIQRQVLGVLRKQHAAKACRQRIFLFLAKMARFLRGTLYLQRRHDAAAQAGQCARCGAAPAHQGHPPRSASSSPGTHRYLGRDEPPCHASEAVQASQGTHCLNGYENPKMAGAAQRHGFSKVGKSAPHSQAKRRNGQDKPSNHYSLCTLPNHISQHAI